MQAVSLCRRWPAGVPELIDSKRVMLCPSAIARRLFDWTRSVRRAASDAPTYHHGDGNTPLADTNKIAEPTRHPSWETHAFIKINVDAWIAIRAGDMAALPLLKRFGVAEAARASAYVYSRREDIDRLADALADVR